MDSRSNLESLAADIVAQTADVPESSDSKSNLKISDLVNTSLENNDEQINTDPAINAPKEQSQQTEINEMGIIVTSLNERNDVIGKEPFNSHKSNLITSSTIDEIANDNLPPEQHLDKESRQENDTKLFPDNGSCSDMQDEEIQLRWDDDDINLDCVHVGPLEEKRSICKDIKDVTVENMYLENTPEKINNASLDVDNQTKKNVMVICEKNISQYESQENISITEFETNNTQQDAKHPPNVHEQCVSQNICKEIVKTNECLTILINNESNQLTAQVDDEKNTIQHKCGDIDTQQENKINITLQIGDNIPYEKNEILTEHESAQITPVDQGKCVSDFGYKDNITDHDKIDQQIQEKNVMRHESEQLKSEAEVKKNVNQGECKDILSTTDIEKNVTQHEYEEIADIVDNEKTLTQIETEPNTNLIDSYKSVTQQEHEETVTLTNNEKSESQHTCEDIVTKLNKGNIISQSKEEERQVIIEEPLIKQGEEKTAAQIDNGIKEIKGKNDDVAPQVEDEKNLIISKTEEITTQHGLKKPDMMLEIPSHELIDFMDEDEPDLIGTLEMSSDEAANEISHDNNYDVNDAVTAITIDVESENIKTPIECEQEASRHNEKKSKMVSEMKNVSKDQSEVCLESISPLSKESTNKEKEQNVLMGEPQPSTSKACVIMEMRRDSDEVGEVSDSLGLLAESTRVLEDEEEQEDEDDADDDYDYDQFEESSNQMGAEFSEDSNAVISETDTAKFNQTGIVNVDECKSKENIVVDYIQQENESCGFHISDIKTQSDELKDISKNTEQTSDSEILITEESDQVNEKEYKSLVDDIDNEKDTDQTDDQRQDTESQFTVIESDLSSPIEPQDPNLDKEEIVLLESSSDEDLSVDTGNILTENAMPCISLDLPEVSQPVECQSNDSPQTPKKNSAEFNKISENDDSGKSSQHELTFNQKLKSPRGGLEVFSIDSDDDEFFSKHDEEKSTGDSELCEDIKCVNIACESSEDVQYYEADVAVLKYYEADRRKKAAVCELCADVVFKRNKELIEGIKNNTPLLELNIGKQVVEISDSDSEKEEKAFEENNEKIGEAGAKFIEENLAETFNTTWQMYNMDSRLEEAKNVMHQELSRLDKDCQEINQMLNECQSATDKLRNELYATFEQERKQLPAITIFDTEYSEFCEYEDTIQEKVSKPEKRTCKQKPINYVPPAKKAAIVLSPENVKQEINTEHSPQKTVDDDSVDVSVVKLSLESAPADLPQPGEVVKPQLRTGMTVYAMRSSFGTWFKAKIIEIQSKVATCTPFTMCRLKFERKVMRNSFTTLPARCIAYEDPPDVRLTIGTRIIASSEKTESFYSGVVAEVPNPVNNYRYLVFFDDGHAKYARHANTRLVSECSPLVWEEVHPNSREFVRQYLLSYPERPMVRLHPNQNVKTEWNGKWWSSRVLEVDASLALILLRGERLEWIYRGSTRLGPLYLEFQAAERQRSRPMPRSGPQHRTNMPYVEYTRYDEQPSKQTSPVQQNEEMRRQRAVAKKSTVSHQLPPVAPPNNAANLDNVTSRVVYYTPKNTIRPYKMTPHQCGPKCKRTDVLPLKDLRTYNPLAKPLLSAWERQIVRFKCQKEVMYRAPCGRRLRNMEELHRYLRLVKSDMSVDLFDFGPSTHCLAEFVLNKCIVGKKDLSHGKENVPVPCVNYYDDSLPEFCSYNTERTPTAGVPLNLNPEFLCGCDCDDDCQDKTKCACWKMTLEGARTIGLEGDVGYVYRRLPEPLPSGIYECNSRCKCKNTCLNRVAQHPLQLKLQVFKTLNRGWGIRALNDVPKGAFLCVYAGNLLTDATANLDGLNEGDEYLAELDYIEIVEQMKEGYEEDIPENLKELNKDITSSDEFSGEETSSSEEEDLKLSKDERDDDFRPGYVAVDPTEFNKRLRTREKRKKEKPTNTNQDDAVENCEDELEEKREETARTEGKMDKDGDKDNVDNFITISDDEEVREPSRFTAQAGMNSKQLVSKYRSVRSYFGKDEACYIMDAKVQGNIGRYLNHSCCPNVFVQNVFVDTHDPRFPWVAFFALSHIRAGTELTWNYNYDVGSVPGKILYCYCGAANCRGRLL